MTFGIEDHGRRGSLRTAEVTKPTEHAAVASYLVGQYGSGKVAYCHVDVGTYELSNGRTLVVREVV